MAKFEIVIILAVATVAVIGFPYRPKDLASEAALGHWDVVHSLLTEMHQQRNNLTPLTQDIRRLAPQGSGDKVYGEAHSSFLSASTINGKSTITGEERGIINDNGKITTYERPISSIH